MFKLQQLIQGIYLTKYRYHAYKRKGLDAVPPLKPLTKEVDDNGVPHLSTKVDYHLNSLLASHLSSPDLTPQDIVEASRSTAAAGASAAKAARAVADEKAAAAAKAVAAAKTALDMIASFPNQALVQDEAARDNMKKYFAAVLLGSNDEELPSKLQLGEDSHGIIPNSCPTCEHKNEQCKVHRCSRARTKADHAISKRVDFDDLGIELDSNRLNESAGGERAKKGIQVTRKRGRPKSK